jgi:hypothetical protein
LFSTMVSLGFGIFSVFKKRRNGNVHSFLIQFGPFALLLAFTFIMISRFV